jgi:hypothetical protein
MIGEVIRDVIKPIGNGLKITLRHFLGEKQTFFTWGSCVRARQAFRPMR